MSTTDASKNKIHIEIEDDPEKWGDKMSKEIEEIKRYVEANEKRDREEMLQVEIFAYKSLKLLLSSLEVKDKEIKALEGLRMSLRDEITELQSSLKKEKENFLCGHRKIDWNDSYGACGACVIKEYADKYDDQLGVEIELEKEKERADRETVSVNELSLANQELVEKKLKLEYKVGELDDRIVSLVILADGYAMRITKAESSFKWLVEAVEKHRQDLHGGKIDNKYWEQDKKDVIAGIIKAINMELYKVLEETKGDLKDYTSPNLLVEQLSERIKELEKESAENLEVWKAQQVHANYLISRIEVLEAQLASIKANPSIGKLIVEISEDEIIDD